MNHHVQFMGCRGSRINGIWRRVTRWRIGGVKSYRIIEVITEKGRKYHA